MTTELSPGRGFQSHSDDAGQGSVFRTRYHGEDSTDYISEYRSCGDRFENQFDTEVKKAVEAVNNGEMNPEMTFPVDLTEIAESEGEEWSVSGNVKPRHVINYAEMLAGKLSVFVAVAADDDDLHTHNSYADWEPSERKVGGEADASMFLNDPPDEPPEERTVMEDESDRPVPRTTTDDIEVRLTLVPRNPPEEMMFRPSSESGQGRFGEMVAISGTVMSESDLDVVGDEIAFECVRCGSMNYVPQGETRGDIRTPVECVSCEREGPFEQQVSESKHIETQFLRVKDDLTSGEARPRNVQVKLEKSSLTDRVNPGEEVLVVGVLDGYPRSDNPAVLEVELDGIEVAQRDSGVDYHVSDDEEERIREIASGDDVINQLTDSVAPSIHGRENAKKAMLLQAASPDSFTKSNGERTRGEIHVAFIGDSGTGKSALMDFSKVLNQHSVSSSATASTAAGLTAAATKVKINGQSRVEMRPGVLPLADGGLAVIDELDKLGTDPTVMNTAMESGYLETAKFGMQRTLRTECCVLAASNPIHGDFNPEADLNEQVDFDPTILGRFDIRIAFQDEPDADMDGMIVQSIIDQHTSSKEPDADLDSEFLAKYVAFCNDEVSPSMGRDDVAEHIMESYTSLRSSLGVEDGTDGLKSRGAEAFIRLAKASATLRLSEEVEMVDAVTATELVVETRASWGFDPARFDASARRWSQDEVKNAIVGTMQDMDIGVSGTTVDEIENEMHKAIPRNRVETVLESVSGSTSRSPVIKGGVTEDGDQRWIPGGDSV